jgi:hypothetical protein
MEDKLTPWSQVTKCLKDGIDKSFPMRRIETIAAVARQRLGEPLIEKTIVLARQRKNSAVQLGVSYSVGEELS